MMQSEDITSLLKLTEMGDRDAESRLLKLLYGELRRLAASYLRSERDSHTLQPTALVHEAYLRLSVGRPRNWMSRTHFMAAAAQAMRRVLVDYARARRTQKRDGIHLSIELAPPSRRTWVEEMLDIDSALQKLSAFDERQARVVELRFFAGLTESEISIALGVSERTVKRDWQCARAWLHGELNTEVDGTSTESGLG